MPDQDAFTTELNAVIAEMSATPAMPKPARPAYPANLPPDPEGLNWWRAKLAGSALAQYVELTDTDREDELPGILDNDDALKKFQTEGIKAARQVLQAADPSLASNLYAAIDQATEELSHIALTELQELEEGNEVKLEKLQKLAKILKVIETKAKVDIINP